MFQHTFSRASCAAIQTFESERALAGATRWLPPRFRSFARLVARGFRGRPSSWVIFPKILWCKLAYGDSAELQFITCERACVMCRASCHRENFRVRRDDTSARLLGRGSKMASPRVLRRRRVSWRTMPRVSMFPAKCQLARGNVSRYDNKERLIVAMGVKLHIALPCTYRRILCTI